MTPDNIDTEALRALKQQPIERIRDAFARAHKIATGGRAHYMSIPADAERDADLILSDAIDELEAIRNAAPALLATVEAQRKEIEALQDHVARTEDALWDRNEERLAVREAIGLKCRTVEEDMGCGCLMFSAADRAREIVAERDALKAEVAKAYANAAHHADRAQAIKAEVEWLRAALQDAVESVRSVPAKHAGFSMIHTPQIGERQVARWDAALRGEESPRG